MRLQIQITKRDIQRGMRSNPASCPIAHALHRAGYPVVAVNCSTATLYSVQNRFGAVSNYRGILSLKATKFVDDFDQGRPVKPFTMIVDFN